MISPFQWGASGQQMTPEQVARMRVAAALQGRQGSETTPVAHWTQAAARGLNGFLAGRGEYQANMQENAGLASADASIQGNPVLSALMGGEQMAAPAAPVQGGMPVAQPAMSQMSAGSDATLNLLREFEGFRETPYWDVNAYRTGYGSDTITTADGRVVPVAQGMSVSREDAERDLQRRVSNEFMPRAQKAAGAAWDGLNENQRAALTSIAYNYGSIPGSVEAALQSGGDVSAAIMGLSGHNDGVNAGRRQREAQLFGGMASAPSGGVAGNMPQAPSGVVAALTAAQQNPWVAQKYGPVIDALMQQEMGRQDASYQQQLRQQDPMYQAQLEAAQIANAQALQPVAPKPIEVGGVLLDPVTYQPIFDSRQPASGGFTLGEGQVRYDANGNVIAQGATPAPEEFRPATAEEAASYGSPAGQFGPDGRFYPVNPPSGMTIESDGRGGFRMVQGAGVQQAQADAQTEVVQADAMLNSIDEILADPALDNATGMLSWTQRIPGTDAYRFGTRSRQLEGQAFLQAFESLKGGGAITEIEGQKATQAIGRLDTAQSAEDYRRALNDLRTVVQAGRARSAGRAGLDVSTEEAARMMDAPSTPARDFSVMSPAELLSIDINSLTDAELDAYLEATK